MKTNLFVNIHP